MVELNQMLSFLAVAIALTLMPGPDILFVTAQSMSRSWRSGITVALGLCTGLIAHVALAAAGVSAVILSSPAAFFIIKLLGAIYLLYLAWKVWTGIRKMKAEGEVAATAEVSSVAEEPVGKHDAAASTKAGFGLYRQGIVMSVLNPKLSLFFLALFPQFVRQENGMVPLQMIQLGVLFMIQAFVIFAVVSVLASSLGGRLMNQSGSWKIRLAVTEMLIYILLSFNLFFL
ncbi:LysE family translocator [Paenibacillus sp. SC116]|uniref:LysE family translocator n=1 Tax=Paenibacillus sp. SC116 TaxID=2968986 RepID=UPI00215AD5F8|nr:LysE family translocator [Paenibacillus sp. SC116]MCR8844220.1 LysE family translocator [Paenibacillus sp. SC116]